jgi:hypothetical protein
MANTDEIEVNGIAYVRKDSVKNTVKVKSLKGMDYVLIRTYSAGVFVGYMKSRKDGEVVLLNARRLWYWDGAASLSQLAMEGVTKPENCKFPMEVSEITLLNVIEVIDVTDSCFFILYSKINMRGTETLSGATRRKPA